MKQIAKMPVRTSIQDPAQGEFELVVERHVETDGIGMGVLSDGTPFLNQRGLANLCGVKNKYIGLISAGWNSPIPTATIRRVKALLVEQGADLDCAAHETFFGKVRVLAYPDTICTAILEFYAFEANLSGRDVAMSNYRRLARYGLKQFIYNQTGYVAREEDDVWRIFRDRVSLTYDAVPDGFFGIFKELSTLIVTLGLNGLHIDEKFVPDISVGMAWSRYWKRTDLTTKFGPHCTYPHNYPGYFPQAASNPQLAACYPEDAIGEFRRWFRQDYIGEGRFQKYLTRKADELLLPKGYVEGAMLALTKGE